VSAFAFDQAHALAREDQRLLSPPQFSGTGASLGKSHSSSISNGIAASLRPQTREDSLLVMSKP
jgi:hypothetical protein